MKRKINQMLVLIATFAVFLTMLLITFVYYDLFRKQVLEDLQSYAVLLTEYDGIEAIQRAEPHLKSENLRITLIDSEGSVEYDSEADASQMGNHNTRPEIMQAWEQGEGYAVRESETLSRANFYYALRLDEHTVFRIAKDAGSIYGIFMKAVPSVLVVFCILLVICLVTAHLLTKKIIIPIEKLAEKLDGDNDITDYEELTPFIQMIRRQHQDIMKNAKMRQEFTANVSHELKTPLTSISGYAELIETGMASEADVTRFAHGIHSSAKRLLTLINDIIRLSELDGTEGAVTLEPINLYEHARNCVEMLALNAEKHQVTISLKGTDCFINGNKQMIEELMYNLCDNAIRYNNEGGRVEVEVCTLDEHPCLVVKDNGIGIPKEHQERIFERFYRVDKSRSKLTGGTGLGLAIVKHIIARHNAKLELESESGRGTTIRVIFAG